MDLICVAITTRAAMNPSRHYQVNIQLVIFSSVPQHLL